METGKIFAEIYHHLKSLEDAHLAKHTISSIVLGVFEKLENSGTEITPVSIEKVLKEELSSFSLKSSKRKTA